MGDESGAGFDVCGGVWVGGDGVCHGVDEFVEEGVVWGECAEGGS